LLAAHTGVVSAIGVPARNVTTLIIGALWLPVGAAGGLGQGAILLADMTTRALTEDEVRILDQALLERGRYRDPLMPAVRPLSGP